MSTLNYLFILKFVFTGFVLFFLPLGIFLRAMPFLRTTGSLLMAVSLSFVFVYPLVLSVFYLDFKSCNILRPDVGGGPDCPPPDGEAANVMAFSNEDLDGKVNAWDALTSDPHAYNDVFEKGLPGDQPFGVIKLAGNAFLIGVFIPTLALLSAAASVSYINRFLGEEIDLSRIVQMV